MTSHPDAESTTPEPGRDASPDESAEQQTVPAVESDVVESDAAATIAGPPASGPPAGERTVFDESEAVHPTSSTDVAPEMTLAEKLDGVLQEFALTLAPEHQDLDRTRPETSLKSAVDSESDQRLRHESFSQSRPVRPRSIQPADSTIVDAGSTASADTKTPDRELDYLTLDKLGEGGMGTVHLARQVALGREVALKQIHQRSSGQQSVRDEFLTEAVLTGKLEHPNIVPIYEMGESDGGELFYSMKNVKGRAWDDTIDGLSLRENLKILIDVCDAMAFAHAEGVIHRDLKPQNIMTGGFGEVLVLDWGMAVLAAPGEDVNASAGGTPCYMAPEMINPPFLVGPRSDVYLLGAILFRFLTGQAPHAGQSAQAAMKSASQNEIVTPDAERIQDLDPTSKLLSVAMQAMATAPGDRYQTVSEFQQAVREFDTHQESLTLATRAAESLTTAELSGDYMQYSEAAFGFSQALALWDGNPEAAKGVERARMAYALCAERKADFELGLSLLDPSVPEQQEVIQRLTAARDERNTRKGRLRRTKQGLAAAAVLIFVIVSVAAFLINQNNHIISQERQIAQANEKMARAAHKSEENQRLQAERNHAEAVAAKLKAEEQHSIAAANLRTAERNAYIADLRMAQLDWENNNIDNLEQLLDRHRNRTDGQKFEWGFWNRLIHAGIHLKGHPNFIYSLDFSPDGTRIVSSSIDGTAKVWDVASGQETLTLKGDKVAESFEPIWSVAFSPDGDRIVTGGGGGGAGGKVKLWNARTGQQTQTLRGHSKAVQCVAFSLDGKQIISSGFDSTLKLWDIATGKETLTLTGHTGPVSSVAISPDGTQLVSASHDTTVKVWNMVTGQETLTLKGHTDDVNSVSFAPDGRRIVTGSDDGTVKVWELTSEQKPPSFKVLKGHVNSVSFSSDGRRVTCGCTDGTIKVWNPDNVQSVITIKAHSGWIRPARFSPDGTRIASGGYDGRVRLWDASTGQETLTLRGHTANVRGMAFSPNGKWIVTGSYDRTVKLWDADSGQEFLTLGEHLTAVTSVSFSPDGSQVVSGSSDRTVKVWDISNGQEALTIKGKHDGPVRSVSFSPDGTRIASGGVGGIVKVWDASSGQELLSFRTHAGFLSAVSFSPDGTQIASGGGMRGEPGEVSLWDAVTGQQRLELKGHSVGVMCVSFSPDGSHIASGSGDGTVRLWEIATGQEQRIFRGHTGVIYAVSFSPDGTRIASGSDDNSVRVWNVTTGHEMLALKEHASSIGSVSFSPDGKRLASASLDSTVKVWDTRVWTPELRAQARARGLLSRKLDHMTSLADLHQNLRSDTAISDRVRQQALDWSELFWKNHTKRIQQESRPPDGQN